MAILSLVFSYRFKADQVSKDSVSVDITNRPANCSWTEFADWVMRHADLHQVHRSLNTYTSCPLLKPPGQWENPLAVDNIIEFFLIVTKTNLRRIWMVGFNDEDLLVNIEVLGGSSSFKIIGPSGGLHELFGSGIAYSNWSAECFFFFFRVTWKPHMDPPHWSWQFHSSHSYWCTRRPWQIPLCQDSFHLIPLSNPQQTRKRRFTRGRSPSDWISLCSFRNSVIFSTVLICGQISNRKTIDKLSGSWEEATW